MAFLYLGGLAFVIGLLLAFVTAPSARRGWLLVALGRRELREQRGAA